MKGELPSGWRFADGCGRDVVQTNDAHIVLAGDLDDLDVDVGLENGIIPWPVIAHFMRRAGWTLTPPGGREP